MKKLLALILSLILAFSLCGCGANESIDDPDPVQSEDVYEESEEEFFEETEEVEENEETEEEFIEETEETEIQEEPEEYIVYRTRTGKRYHREWCEHLKSKYELTVDEAVAMGLTPCSVCQP